MGAKLFLDSTFFQYLLTQKLRQPEPQGGQALLVGKQNDINCVAWTQHISVRVSCIVYMDGMCCVCFQTVETEGDLEEVEACGDISAMVVSKCGSGMGPWP